MYTLSAFADEISPDPVDQVDLLAKNGVRYIELRSVHKTNVLDLTDHQIGELKSLFDARGFGLSAIGSPIGKVKIDTDFEPHFKRFERAVALAQLFDTTNIRVFRPPLTQPTPRCVERDLSAQERQPPSGDRRFWRPDVR